MRELQAARETGSRVPDFFIVGHAKCGTTALYEMLRAHPQIYMPDLKETQFLAREPQDQPLAPNIHPRTLTEYLSLFDAPPSEQTRYDEQQRRYHECLGREQVLALIYDAFRADNQRVVREVLRFLDVDDSLEIAPSEANPSVRLHSPRMHQLVHALSRGRGPVSLAVKTSVKAVTPRRVRRRALRAADRKVPDSGPRRAEEPIMAELRSRFKGEVVAASEYLERDLVSLWGYDDV